MRSNCGGRRDDEERVKTAKKYEKCKYLCLLIASAQEVEKERQNTNEKKEVAESTFAQKHG